MPPRSHATSLALALALASAAARADPPAGDVRLTWVRAAGADRCPSPASVERDVARRLGREPWARDAARSIEVVASRPERRWLASIFVRDRDGALLGTRDLAADGDDCVALAASVALAVALAIDPDAVEPPPAPAPVAPSAPPPPRAAPRARRVRPPAPRRPTATRARGGGVALRAVAGAGLLPGIAPGVALGAEVLSVGDFRVTTGFVLFPEARTGDGAFGFGLAAGSLSACAATSRRARAALVGCAGALVGAMHGVVYDLRPVGAGDRPWVALQAGARVEARVAGALYAELGADLVVPLLRHRYGVVGRPEVAFQQRPVGGAGHLGVGLRF